MECERNVSAGSELANNLVVTCQVQRDPHQGFTGWYDVRMQGACALCADVGLRHESLCLSPDNMEQMIINAHQQHRGGIILRAPSLLLTLTVLLPLKPQLVHRCVAWRVLQCRKTDCRIQL